jgi:hypothetical protein
MKYKAWVIKACFYNAVNMASDALSKPQKSILNIYSVSPITRDESLYTTAQMRYKFE